MFFRIMTNHAAWINSRRGTASDFAAAVTSKFVTAPDNTFKLFEQAAINANRALTPLGFRRQFERSTRAGDGARLKKCIEAVSLESDESLSVRDLTRMVLVLLGIESREYPVQFISDVPFGDFGLVAGAHGVNVIIIRELVPLCAAWTFAIHWHEMLVEQRFFKEFAYITAYLPDLARLLFTGTAMDSKRAKYLTRIVTQKSSVDVERIAYRGVMMAIFLLAREYAHWVLNHHEHVRHGLILKQLENSEIEAIEAEADLFVTKKLIDLGVSKLEIAEHLFDVFSLSSLAHYSQSDDKGKGNASSRRLWSMTRLITCLSELSDDSLKTKDFIKEHVLRQKFLLEFTHQGRKLEQMLWIAADGESP